MTWAGANRFSTNGLLGPSNPRSSTSRQTAKTRICDSQKWTTGKSALLDYMDRSGANAYTGMFAINRARHGGDWTHTRESQVTAGTSHVPRSDCGNGEPQHYAGRAGS